MSFYQNQNANINSSPNIMEQKDRDSIIHDEIAKNLKNLAKASDDYYASYLKLCQARKNLSEAEKDVKNMEEACIKAKNEYDFVINRNRN